MTNITFELDTTGIKRLDEILQRQLHNSEEVGSRFIDVIVPERKRQPTVICYVFDNKTLVGWTVGQTEIDKWGRDIQHLKRAYHEVAAFIDPAYRNKGLARKALEKLIDQLKHPGNRYPAKHKLFAAWPADTILRSFRDKRFLVSTLER